jgi:IstB-like ATP binding protein
VPGWLHDAAGIGVNARDWDAREVQPLARSMLDHLRDALVELCPQLSEVAESSRFGRVGSGPKGTSELFDAACGESCLTGGGSAVADHATDVVGRVDKAQVGRSPPRPANGSGRVTEAGNGVLVLGPVGVGKTHLASALGHIAIRRRLSVHAARADKLFTRLRAARLDTTLGAEIRKLARVDVLILDDFALRPLDATETNDFYELVVERHRKASTIVTSNREPAEWLSMMSDALLAQSAVDRLTSGAHTLVIEGPSYRQREPCLPRAVVDAEGPTQ